ncbi:hypothetical protein B0T16DRAFT_341660 [Cercophora newfieldiana]|uniref:Uncharacterized protein n=1 Tax=Cercophora newfieldiana TaxID=92897 RepID=A0AA40CZZ0_9PEZI|nr:hypothetical protein B0T16DRAFT_341660 [Cercophora newfieldiana]
MASSIASRPLPAVSPSAVSPSAASTSVSASSDPPTVRFTNTQDLFDTINCTVGDFLTVTNVSPSQFTEIDREREKRRRKFRFRRYDSKSRILTISIPTAIHEALHLGLYRLYWGQLFRNGTEESWKDSGCATFQAEQGHPGEGDSTGSPLPERRGADKWPTLVVESGYSQTLPELRRDMRWWFQASNHDVKIVILVKFDNQQHHILLEKWEEEETINPVMRQSITITRDETTNPVSYNVTRGPLVLGFRLLYLRDPGPQERDFVFSIQDLQLYAGRVWDELPRSD